MSGRRRATGWVGPAAWVGVTGAVVGARRRCLGRRTARRDGARRRSARRRQCPSVASSVVVALVRWRRARWRSIPEAWPRRSAPGASTGTPCCRAMDVGRGVLSVRGSHRQEADGRGRRHHHPHVRREALDPLIVGERGDAAPAAGHCGSGARSPARSSGPCSRRASAPRPASRRSRRASRRAAGSRRGPGRPGRAAGGRAGPRTTASARSGGSSQPRSRDAARAGRRRCRRRAARHRPGAARSRRGPPSGPRPVGARPGRAGGAARGDGSSLPVAARRPAGVAAGGVMSS